MISPMLFGTAVMALSLLMLPLGKIRWVLLIQLFALPLSHVYVSGPALTLTMGFAALPYFLTGGVSSPRLSVPWLVVFVWMAWTIAVVLGFWQNQVSGRSVFQAIEFLLYGTLVVFIYNVAVRGWLPHTTILLALTASALLLAGAFVVTRATVPIGWPTSVMGRNEGSVYLVLGGILPALYLLSCPGVLRRLFAGVTIAAAWIAIAYTGSRTGVLVSTGTIVLFGFLWFSDYTWGPAFTIGIVVLTAAAMLTPLMQGLSSVVGPAEQFSNLERLALLQTSADLWIERPVLGWGWGAVDHLLSLATAAENRYPHPHSTFARFAVELGTVGVILSLVLFGGLLAASVRTQRTGRREIATYQLLTGLCAIAFAFTDSLFYGANRGFILSITIGLVLAAPRSLPTLPGYGN